MYYKTRISCSVYDPILSQLIEQKVVGTHQLQTGTAGKKETFYRLLAKPTEIVIKFSER